MDSDRLEEYFEDLATRYAPIGHTPEAPRYVCLNIEEILSDNVRNLDLSHYCLMLENPAGKLEDNGGDGYFEKLEIAFMLLRQCQVSNFAEERLIKAEARKHATQLLIKIAEEGEFCDFSLNSVEFEKVGPVFNNCYGYRYTFEASSPLLLQPNPADWNEPGP